MTKGFAFPGTVLVCLLLSFALAQTSAAHTPPIADSHFLQTQWTPENGLPQNSVTALAQTPDGYLWLGTFGGLARFDGLKFTIFNSGKVPGLKSDRITALHVGRDGTLWIGTQTGDIGCLRQGEFQTFSNAAYDLSNNYIQTIYEDRGGALWVGTYRGDLTRYLAADATRVEHYSLREELPYNGIRAVCEDTEGQLWICTSYGLWLLRAGQLTSQFTVKRADWKRHLLNCRPRAEGGLWLATPAGLALFQQGKVTPYVNIPPLEIWFAGLAAGKNNALWFSAWRDRLYFLKDGILKASQLVANSKFSVRALLEDHEGNLWLGTNGGGLIRLRERRVTMISAANQLPDTEITSITESGQGLLWVGTGRGLCQLKHDLASCQPNRLSPGSEEISLHIKSLYVNKTGELWAGMYERVLQFKAGQLNGQPIEHPLKGVGFIQAIAEDRQGHLWLGTLKGLVLFRDGNTVHYQQKDGLVHNDVRAILTDHTGALWLGTVGGLSRFKDGVFTNYTTAEGLSNNYVRDIYEDQDGALWLSTYGGGLNRLQQGRVTSITTRNGLYDDFISRLLVDEQDRFWLLGNHGIFRVSRRELIEVAEGKSKTIFCAAYNAADGMIPSEGNGGSQPAGWRARDGRLWFPTIEGVAVVDSREHNPHAPPVFLERVLLEGQPLSLTQPVIIHPGHEQLEIHYTGLSLGKPEQVRFKYRMAGLQEDWADIGTRRAMYFTHLPPGQYVFQLKALSPDGVGSPNEASLVIIVQPPFWRTAWFITLVLLGIAGASVLAYYRRTAQYRRRAAQQEAFARQLLESQERERQRLAAELHDGLSQSLIIIKRRALASLAAPHDPDRTQEQLEEIAEASTQAIDEVKDIIFDLRPRQLDRLGFSSAVSDLLDRVAAVNGWQLTKELDELDGLLSPAAENSLYRIVQEALNNISKHAAATSVRVAASLNHKNQRVELIITDNGRGFAVPLAKDKTWKSGLGLPSILERARLLKGHASIQSLPGQGTTIQLSLPLKGKLDAR